MRSATETPPPKSHHPSDSAEWGCPRVLPPPRAAAWLSAAARGRALREQLGSGHRGSVLKGDSREASAKPAPHARPPLGHLQAGVGQQAARARPPTPRGQRYLTRRERRSPEKQS